MLKEKIGFILIGEMDNMKKKFMVLLSLVLVAMVLVSVPVQAAVQPYVWPGRPGGNGDGSEEWLQGEYGQPNGPYQTIYQTEGRVSDLGKESKIEIIATAIISGGISKVHPSCGAVVTVAGLGMALRSENYEGAYYKMISSVSGRRMKIQIRTYARPDYTYDEHVYTHYIEW